MAGADLHVMTSEDPIVMYLVVNTDLGMSCGKLAAQVGHGVQFMLQAYFKLRTQFDSGHELKPPDWVRVKATEHWLESSDYTKIVLAASTEKFNKVIGKEHPFVVVDNGKTELAPGTQTVLAFWPTYKKEAPRILRGLKLLQCNS